ncbi:MAG: 50S ribosomal protein L25 [Candidatus Izemoplasmatales bacterium]
MKLEKRTESLKSVREGHKVPGVIFGKSIEPEAIQIDEKEFNAAYHQYGLTQTFDVKLGRKKLSVYIKEVQRHHINHNVFLNVKLHKVVAGDMIKAALPINLIGKEAVEKPGIIIQLLADSVEVEYGIGEGISHIDIDVSNLEIGQSIKVEDLKLPDGIMILDSMEKLIVNVVETRYEEEVTSEDVDPMDVEVITEKTE